MARSPLTVLSIFVNPSQFAPTEDLATYPRNLPQDLSLLESLLPPAAEPAAGLAALQAPTVAAQEASAAERAEQDDSPLVVFCPDVREMYPNGITTVRSEQRGTFVEVQGFGDVLCV